MSSRRRHNRRVDDLPRRVRRSVETLDACSANPPLVRIGDYGDKYALDNTPEIDCASRWELCKGICCRLEFSLSQQDLDEGVVTWNRNRPYLRASGEQGRCVHQDCESGACGIYLQRPAPCRTYDCRSDKRIWIDFEARQVNPAILEPGWPGWIDEESEWPE